MKKKIAIAAAVLAVIFAAANLLSKKQPVEAQPAEKASLGVTVQSVSDSASLKQTVEYPAVVAGEQEATITAKSAGNVSSVNFDLGSRVGVGSLLVKIDNTGNNLGFGDQGFRSSEVQQSQLSVKQAEEQVDVAKKNRDSLQTLYDAQKKNPSAAQTITKAQIKAAKEQVDIAKIQLENAKIGLRGTLDDHLVTSPIQGFITKKSVDVGDSVSVGQELATISKTSLTKVQFFVAKEELSNFQPGGTVTITEDGKSMPGTVARIAPEADPTTKRFLVEAKPTPGESLLIGSVISVSTEIVRGVSETGNIILPLSAITVGQNESFVFIVDNGQAKKVPVTVVRVQGEFAEVKSQLGGQEQIVIGGSKLLSDGDPVTVQN